MDRLRSGAEDSQWIQIDGIVRSAAVREGHLRVALMSSGRLVTVIPLEFDGADYSKLIDSHVEVTGASGSVFNRKRQMIGINDIRPEAVRYPCSGGFAGPTLDAHPAHPDAPAVQPIHESGPPRSCAGGGNAVLARHCPLCPRRQSGRPVTQLHRSRSEERRRRRCRGFSRPGGFRADSGGRDGALGERQSGPSGRSPDFSGRRAQRRIRFRPGQQWTAAL